MACEHPDFVVVANVNRIIDKKAFMADISICCKQCGLPFEFVGVDAGLSFDKPMAAPDAQEIRLPIRPKGCKIMPAIPGFEIRAN